MKKTFTLALAILAVFTTVAIHAKDVTATKLKAGAGTTQKTNEDVRVFVRERLNTLKDELLKLGTEYPQLATLKVHMSSGSAMLVGHKSIQWIKKDHLGIDRKLVVNKGGYYVNVTVTLYTEKNDPRGPNPTPWARVFDHYQLQNNGPVYGIESVVGGADTEKGRKLQKALDELVKNHVNKIHEDLSSKKVDYNARFLEK